MLQARLGCIRTGGRRGTSEGVVQARQGHGVDGMDECNGVWQCVGAMQDVWKRAMMSRHGWKHVGHYTGMDVSEAQSDAQRRVLMGGGCPKISQP